MELQVVIIRQMDLVLPHLTDKGSVSSTIAVTPGEILYIYVGGQGKHCEGAGTSSCGNLSGGWNGGGTGGKSGSGGVPPI